MESEPLPQTSAQSNNNADLEDINDRPVKRVKMDDSNENNRAPHELPKDEVKPRDDRDTKKGQAPIKAE
jgi:hypothetical protein